MYHLQNRVKNQFEEQWFKLQVGKRYDFFDNSNHQVLL